MISDLESVGWTTHGTEITVDVPSAGVRVRLDAYSGPTGGVIVEGEGVVTPKPCFFDSKNGPGAGLEVNQEPGYPGIRTSGGIPKGKNAAGAGLPPGKPIPPTDVAIYKHPRGCDDERRPRGPPTA